MTGTAAASHICVDCGIIEVARQTMINHSAVVRLRNELEKVVLGITRTPAAVVVPSLVLLSKAAGISSDASRMMITTAYAKMNEQIDDTVDAAVKRIYG